MPLKFKCPKCSHDELEIVEASAVMSSKVVNIDEECYFEYDLIECDGGCTDRFQCFKCGCVLKDENCEAITTNEEVVEWVKKNCSQGN